MLQFTYIQEADFSRGIDQYSTPSTIPPGCVEDVVDMDIEGKSLEKRRGYEKLAGDAPLVVSSVDISSGDIILTFDETIDLSSVSIGPIWLQGKINYGSGIYTAVNEYFSSFSIADSYALAAGIDQTLTTDLSLDLGLTSTNALIAATIDDNIIYLDRFEINPSTLVATVTYSSDEDLTLRLMTPITEGNSYGSADYGDPSELVIASSVTIPATTHQLSPTIIPMIYLMESASNYEYIIPDELSINVAGDVTIEFAEEIGAKFKFYAMEGSFVEGVAVTGSSYTEVEIDSPQSEYMIAACYVEDLTNPASPVLKLIIPDSIEYTGSSHVVTFTHISSADLGNYRIVYAYCRVPSNRMLLTGSALSDIATTINCSLAVSGVDQELLSQKSKITYVGEYADNSEALMSTGGMLFRSIDPNVSIDLDMTGRVASDVVIGPLFSKATYPRTLGCLSSDSATILGFLPVADISWVAGNTYRVTITASAYTATDTLTNLLVGNYLQIQGSTQSRFNGSFLISTAGQITPSSFYCDVVVPGVTSARWNDTDSGALCAVFDDEIPFLVGADISAQAGDSIILSSTLTISVRSKETNNIVIGGVEEKISLYAGQKLGITGSRETLPITSHTFVIGDIVTSGSVTTRVIDISGTDVTFREQIAVSAGLISIDCPLRWQLVLTPDSFLGTRPLPANEVITGSLMRGSMLFNVGRKYDGDKIYTSGLPRMQLHTAISIDEGAGIAVSTKIADVDSSKYGAGATSDTIYVPANDIAVLAVNDQILVRRTVVAGGKLEVDPEDMYTVEAIDAVANTVKLDRALTIDAAATATYELATFVTYRYFLRLSITDRLGSQSVSASLGSGDLVIRLTKSSSVYLKAHYLLPSIEMIDYSRCELQVFRRRETSTSIGNFYLVGTIPLSERTASGIDYLEFTDANSNIVVEREENADPVVDPMPLSYGTNRYRPPISSIITSANNQLICGDYYGEQYNKILISGSASYSAYAGKEFTVDGTTYHVTSAAYDTVASASSVANTSFTLTLTTGTASVTAGDYIFVGRDSAKSIADRPTLLGWYVVDSKNDGAKTLTVLCPGIISPLDTEDIHDLLVWHVGSGKIPLVHDLAYANNGQSINKDDSDKIGLTLHLSQAINATKPGVYAHAGQDFPSGVIEITGNVTTVTVPSVTGARIYCNGALTSTATASITRYGSRTAASIQEFPEVFQDIEADSGKGLPLIQDYSPDDGDVITGATAFFALAAFGAAQQSSVLLVFKNRSAYVVDMLQKYVGSTNYFQQIDTRGIGCEAKNSVLNTADGVMFVSNSLLYTISRQFTLQMSGLMLTRFWKHGVVDATRSSEICATSSTFSRKLLFTVPTTDGSGKTTFVYNIPVSNEIPGGWTRYSNIDATLWAEYSGLPIFGTDSGYVAIMRNNKRADDHQDAGAIITPSITFRPIDGGMPTNLKFLKFVSLLSSAEYDYAKDAITVSISNNFAEEYSDMDQFVLRGSDAMYIDGLSDNVRQRLSTVAFSPAQPKAGWYQVKLTSDNTGDFNTLCVARLVFKIAALRTRAEIQAAET